MGTTILSGSPSARSRWWADDGVLFQGGGGGGGPCPPYGSAHGPYKGF